MKNTLRQQLMHWYNNGFCSYIKNNFDFNEDDLRTAIKERKNNSYWVAKKNLEYKDIQKFESYLNYEYADTKEEETTVQNTKGIWFEKKYKRMYPYNSLACSLLGFANSDNSATIG